MIVSKFNKKMKILKLHLHPLKIFDYSQKAGSVKQQILMIRIYVHERVLKDCCWFLPG